MRAAMRRGSSTSTWPGTMESSSGGTRVVFPAPGGASITRLGEARKAEAIAGSRSSIGRLDFAKLSVYCFFGGGVVLGGSSVSPYLMVTSLLNCL